MLGLIEANGGRIDKIYYCTDMESESPNRKPNPGMGLQAKKEFPEIDLKRSLMVGNTMNDMVFGKKLGCYTFFIASNRPAPALPNETTDAVFTSLKEISELIVQ